MNKSIQSGDDWRALPGTCDQTGNRAPKFPWSSSPIGRFARIAALCCVYRLGYDDERMAKLHQFPNMNDIYKLFCALLPWFPDYYDSLRAKKAKAKKYTGPLEPFGAAKVDNRVRYCFAKPGRKNHDPTSRVYGISVEHPSSIYQREVGGRGEVFARVSLDIDRRLILGESFTQEEAEGFGV